MNQAYLDQDTHESLKGRFCGPPKNGVPSHSHLFSYGRTKAITATQRHTTPHQLGQRTRYSSSNLAMLTGATFGAVQVCDASGFVAEKTTSASSFGGIDHSNRPNRDRNKTKLETINLRNKKLEISTSRNPLILPDFPLHPRVFCSWPKSVGPKSAISRLPNNIVESDDVFMPQCCRGCYRSSDGK